MEISTRNCTSEEVTRHCNQAKDDVIDQLARDGIISKENKHAAHGIQTGRRHARGEEGQAMKHVATGITIEYGFLSRMYTREGWWINDSRDYYLHVPIKHAPSFARFLRRSADMIERDAKKRGKK